MNPTSDAERGSLVSMLADRASEISAQAVASLGPVENWPEGLVYAIQLIDLARQPMVIAWGPQRLIFHNRAYAPIVDGKGDVQGLPLHEVFAEAWDIIGGLFARAEAGESVYLENFEVPITRRGRTETSWWTLSYSPLPRLADETGGVLCIVHETTALHLAEQRTHAAQEELTRITDVVPGLLWRADSFGRTIWQSGRLRALSAANGADANTVWRKLVHPGDIDDVLAELARAKSERRAFSKALRLKTPGGDYRWHLARSEPVFSDAGAVTGWCGVATDIQSSVDTLETLDHRTALFSQFAANSAGLLWTVDLATLQIDRLSQNFGAIWPELNRPIPWTWAQFLATAHEADRPVLQAGLERAAAGEVVGGKFRIVTEDGAIRVLEGTSFPILTADDRIPCVGGILKDITREVRRVAHLIDGDPGNQNRISHGLRRLGFEVTVFDAVETMADVAGGLAAAPLLYHHRGDEEELTRLAALMKTVLSGDPWIVLQSDDRPAREAVAIMKLGAADIIDAAAPISELASAVTTAASTIRRIAKPPAPSPAPRYRLTSREFQIAQGLVAGGTNKTIGQSLGISPRTVESHRSRLMERLGVGTLAELVALVTSPAFEVDIRA